MTSMKDAFKKAGLSAPTEKDIRLEKDDVAEELEREGIDPDTGKELGIPDGDFADIEAELLTGVTDPDNFMTQRGEVDAED